MMRNMRRGIPNIMKQGTTQLDGIDEAVIQNLRACKELAEVTRTSLGPQGMNKMIINHLGRLFVTSDTATILSEMEIEHPAATLIKMAAAAQESEMGDGSNFVLTIAGQLLGFAEDLIYVGLQPADISAGYALAAKKAIEITKELVVKTITTEQLFDEEAISSVVSTAIASKQYGFEKELSKLVAKACIAIMPKNTFNFNTENIRVLKVLGNGQGSHVVKGMVFPFSILPSKLKVMHDANIAVFTCGIDVLDTETKSTALVTNADELMAISSSEEAQIEQLVLDVKNSNINVIVCGGSVSDLAAHFLEKHGIMCLRLSSKFELRRLCTAVGARPLVSFGAVDPQHAGFCTTVQTKEVGLSTFTYFESDECAVSTIVLRASTFNLLNDLERGIDDGVNTIKAMGKERSGHFVAGAGAYEMELSKRLYEYAETVPGLQQYGVEKFAESLTIIPRCIAENSGLDATKVVSNLARQHALGNANAGVNVTADRKEDPILDAAANGIYDLAVVKTNAIRLLIDSVMCILSISASFQCRKAGGPKAPKQSGHWDEED